MPSHLMVTPDGVYLQYCEPRLRLYPRRHEALTLADYERAFRVFMRDQKLTQAAIEVRLDQLRDQEQRAHALTCVMPLPFGHRD